MESTASSRARLEAQLPREACLIGKVCGVALDDRSSGQGVEGALLAIVAANIEALAVDQNTRS